MLKPEAFQTIEEFIRMIEDLDKDTCQEAIRETNNKLEKVEGVQSAPLRMPITFNPVAQRQKTDTSDLFCPHCDSHEIARNGSVRGILRLVCKDCKKSFGSKYGNVTYESNRPESKWDKYLEGMVPCSSSPRNVISASSPPIPGGLRYSGLSCSRRKMFPSQE